ncbi:MAG: hypothetical protein PF637_09520 [Spirochaetes bacterium]|jgi:hypothetical protein|nr:hypothetical protein [Spirochaetota bacterium]
MKLSEQETAQLLERLRNRYDEYSKKYNPAWFNRNTFEDRVTFAYENRMDMSAFILAEVANFEKMKEKYEKQKERSSFANKVDKIIEEQMERISKYPRMEFHPRAGIEISHMYGALYHLADRLYPVLWLIVDDTSSREKLQQLESELFHFAQPTLSRLPRFTEDYALLLARPNLSELEVEKGKNNYLKEAAFLLFHIAAFCDYLIKNPGSLFEHPVSFSRGYESAEKKKKLSEEFSSLTGFGAVFKIKHYCEDLVADFRLTAFRPVNTSSYK